MNKREEINRLKAEGLTHSDIAKRLGCAKSTVSYYIGSEMIPAKTKSCFNCGAEYKSGKATSTFCSISCKRADRDIRFHVKRDSDGVMTEQMCSLCEKIKSSEDFHFRDKKSGLKQSRCKPCNIENTVKWQSENKGRYVEQWKRNSSLRNELVVKARTYNIHPEDLQSLRDEASGLCQVCGKKPIRWLVTDHCHEKGHVRGVLCERCNQALGLMEDDVDRLRSAALYLERPPMDYRPFEAPPRRTKHDRQEYYENPTSS